MSNIRYEFIMSQITPIRDMKENEKIKISFVFYEGCQGPCIFKVCKNRDLLETYQALMEVRHPNLAVIYDCVYENGNTYVLEEYIPGKTLAEILEANGTFSEEETRRIMMELCDGLEVLHRHEPSIIHNDIKASNIMIREDGAIKLFDFDISRTYKEGSYKNTKLMGTYEYAAPEHYGFGQSEPCTDIYSLGVTMHEMLTGKGLDHEHNVTYQGTLANVIRKCVEIDRKKRYASAALLKADLAKGQSRVPFKLWWILAAICGVFLLVVGGLCLGDYFAGRGEKPDVPGVEGSPSEERSEDESLGNTEGASSTEESEDTEGADTEVSGETEKSTDSDDTQVPEETEDIDDIEDSTTPDSSQGSESTEVKPPVEDTKDDVVSTPQKETQIIYQIQDTFLAMDAWNDGTFLFMEEISGDYYLRSSDGKSTLLEGVNAPRGAQLKCNPYTDQMYLVTIGFEAKKKVYSVTKGLEIEFLTDCYNNSDDGIIGFFSDGTVAYGANRYDINDWSCVAQNCNAYSANIINDKQYSFEFISVESGFEYYFLERDEACNIVREFPLEDEGIIFCGEWSLGTGIYNNSEDVYFIGMKDNKLNLYCFDGEGFTITLCLDDYEVGFIRQYKICVTDDAFIYYNKDTKTILKCVFE